MTTSSPSSTMLSPQGPINYRRGPYVRCAQAIAPDLWLVESQRGTKGTGKVWNPAIIRNNPNFGKPYPFSVTVDNRKFLEIAECKLVRNGYRKGQNVVRIHKTPDFIEGFFANKADAVRFMIEVSKLCIAKT